MECLFRVRRCCFCIPLSIRYGSMIIGLVFLIHSIVLINHLGHYDKEDYSQILLERKIEVVWHFHVMLYGGQFVLCLMLLIGVARQIDIFVAFWIFYMLVIAILEIMWDLEVGLLFYRAELKQQGGSVLGFGIPIFCVRIYCIAMVNTYYWRS